MDNHITIIVPVYNAEKTLARCVESIIAQSVSDWRLILVNDGSSDESGNICNDYQGKDSRIMALHKLNGGAGSARNFGLAHCSTDWVTFIDADDTIENDYLANFHLDLHIGETDVVIMQGFRRVSPEFEELGEKIDLKQAVYSGKEMLTTSFVNDRIFEFGQSVGKLYSVATIRDAGIKFPESFSLSEDHYFFLSFILHAKKIISYPGSLYNYIWEADAGLSRRIHPYPQLLDRYRALTSLCSRLKCNAHFPVETIYQIDYFATTGSLSLLLQSLFQQENDRQIRTKILSEILKDRSFIISTFVPHHITGKILKLILIYCPISVSQFILSKIKC